VKVLEVEAIWIQVSGVKTGKVTPRKMPTVSMETQQQLMGRAEAAEEPS
jgi:hypothetical protein